METITDRDVHDYTARVLDAVVDEYDVDAIVRDLIDQYGLRETYDDDELWPVVALHEKPAAVDVDPAEAFRDAMIATLATRQVGQPAVWSSEGVTVTIKGGSRVYHSWPQVLARVTIATPDGDAETINGEDLASWDELWSRVETARDGWSGATDPLLAHLRGAHAGLERAERAAATARSRRDALVREAATAGVTAYRIAKTLKVAESTIGRILAPLR